MNASLNNRIIGHQDQQGYLLKALEQNRVSHAYIFSGPFGVGKRQVALAFAQALICQNPLADKRACLQCTNCQRIERNVHPDIQVFQRDKSIFSVETIRHHIIDWAFRKPREGNIKVGIIAEADAIDNAGANVFLKTLEEPPRGMTWILLYDQNPSTILPTILSRAQLLYFSPLKAQELEELLHKDKNFKAQIEDIKSNRVHYSLAQPLSGSLHSEEAFLLRIAQGSPGELLKAFSYNIYEFRQWLLEVLTSSDPDGPFLKAEKLLDQLLSQHSGNSQQIIRKQLSYLIRIAETWFRDLLTIQFNTKDSLLLFNPDLEPLLKQATTSLSYQETLRYLKLLEDISSSLLQNNLSPRLSILRLVLKLWNLFPHLTLSLS